MAQPFKVRDYLEQVLQQVRYRKIHPELARELEAHIEDQKEAYMAEGLDEETALSDAVRQMGDPVTVGTQLDRLYRPRLEGSMVVLVILLLLSGMVLRLFTSPQVIDGLEYYYKQMAVTLLGVGLMFFIYTLDYSILGRYPRRIFFALGAVGVLVFLVSPLANGQYCYVPHVLILFPAAFAGIVYSMRGRGYGGLAVCGLYFLMPVILAFMAPSLTALLIVSFSCLILLTAAVAQGHFNVRKPVAYLMMYLPAVMAFALLLLLMRHRLAVALSPETDALGMGYQELLVRKVLSSAQWIGRGNLPPATQHVELPGISNDFLITYAIYRFGWIALFVIVLLFACFVGKAIILCLKQKSVLARLVSFSVVLTVAFQVVFYLVSNLGFTLFVPLTLPFVSEGNGALLANLCLMGILLSVFRTGRFMRDPRPAGKTMASPFIHFEDGRLIIDFRSRRTDLLS